ncbi:MAG: Immunoglobulin (CD79A) binding protein 1 [Pleopsidium flavum]|nr:MAG: Immunoglobulin (CD79A) binding protein 1 [Pleopsidium flavum]
MTDSPRNVRTLFDSGNRQRKQLESSYDANSSTYQENLRAAISTFEECRRLADEISLFSQNESLEDISSGDLQYLLISYYLAELILRNNNSDRKPVLNQAQTFYENYLNLLDTYGVLSTSNRKLYESYLDNRKAFSTASTTDVAARRESKIKRFRQEKELKGKLEARILPYVGISDSNGRQQYLAQNPTALQNDDSALRDLHIANINLCTHRTFQSLDIISQELQLLAFAPPASPPSSEALAVDKRERSWRGKDGYSERLDAPLSQLVAGGKAGPILSKDGKPLKPFVLLDRRQRIQEGVFKPGHSLPTMTIDEYLEEEKRRGGMIEGGGEKSGIRPDPDEDNIDKADEETIKAREWDEFKETNPKGSGNTLNKG